LIHTITTQKKEKKERKRLAAEAATKEGLGKKSKA